MQEASLHPVESAINPDTRLVATNPLDTFEEGEEEKGDGITTPISVLRGTDPDRRRAE